MFRGKNANRKPTVALHCFREIAAQYSPCYALETNTTLESVYAFVNGLVLTTSRRST
jgi:hypothetical protein